MYDCDMGLESPPQWLHWNLSRTSDWKSVKLEICIYIKGICLNRPQWPRWNGQVYKKLLTNYQCYTENKIYLFCPPPANLCIYGRNCRTVELQFLAHTKKREKKIRCLINIIPNAYCGNIIYKIFSTNVTNKFIL